MRTTTTVIIGAGQCGLAMSHYLAALGIDHVILESGEVANSWATERWDSLRLLTPNWQSRLPGGFAYDGRDPDGYMDMDETVCLLDAYAREIAAPVETHTRVLSVLPAEGGYVVETDRGTWRCRTLVVASGACNIASVPRGAEGLAGSVRQLTPFQYRNPDQLDDGGVLVVGASATGVQLADEIQRSGRQVLLAVGEHVRAPRTYRGRDIKWWMDETGVLDMSYTEVDDIRRARRVPSLQLAGSAERATLDLNALMAEGVEITGRVAAMTETRLQFSGGLGNMCALADLKMNRLLDTIDTWADAHGLGAAIAPPSRPEPTRVPSAPRLDLDLGAGEISTILWATGFRPDHSWLHLPVFDRKGRIRHDGGVVPSPGVYVMGLPFLRKRKSTLIDGTGDDARALAVHLRAYLDCGALAA